MDSSESEASPQPNGRRLDDPMRKACDGLSYGKELHSMVYSNLSHLVSVYLVNIFLYPFYLVIILYI